MAPSEKRALSHWMQASCFVEVDIGHGGIPIARHGGRSEGHFLGLTDPHAKDVSVRIEQLTELVSSWTLGRDGHRLTCALVRKPSGVYLLRLSHEGQRILDERCDSPQHAVERSLRAFGVLVARGWLPESSVN